MAKLLSDGVKHQFVPEHYIFPPSKRPGIHVNTCEQVPIIHLTGNDQLDVSNQILSAGKEFGFFQVWIEPFSLSVWIIQSLTRSTTLCAGGWPWNPSRSDQWHDRGHQRILRYVCRRQGFILLGGSNQSPETLYKPRLQPGRDAILEGLPETCLQWPRWWIHAPVPWKAEQIQVIQQCYSSNCDTAAYHDIAGVKRVTSSNCQESCCPVHFGGGRIGCQDPRANIQGIRIRWWLLQWEFQQRTN